jgi:Lon protease-like protein
MGRALPLFPLGTVLFPGLVLPLHVFEERYRALVRHVMSLPEGSVREFGVVAIHRGWEVEQVRGSSRTPGSPGPAGTASLPGASAGGRGPSPTGTAGAATTGGDGPAPPELELRAPVTLHEIGCTAEVRQVTEHPDGRFDLVTLGRRRFRIARVDRGAAPYLVADVEYLTESLGAPDAADRLAPRVLAAFRRYLSLLRRSPEEIAEQLPEEPAVLSHLVAATAVLTVDDRQRLLAEPDTVSRLRAELSVLSREEALLRRVRAVPVPLSDLAVPMSAN